MSCYEWESGAITLPAKVFAKFRKEFIAKYNVIQQGRFTHLKFIRARAMLGGKGKRGYNYEEVMLSFTSNYDEEILVSKLFGDNKSSGKPKAVTKKMFNFVNGKDNSFPVDGGEAGMRFDKEARTVSWGVSENNHAVESARRTKEAQMFFGMLSRVVWTRGSGGTIVGNDEYNRDSNDEGGGSNYVTATYGK